jgi:GAF domain-containing protein
MANKTAVLKTYLGISYRSPEEGVLRLLIELGAQFVGAREGSLLVLDEKKSDLVFAMTVGGEASEKELAGQHVPLGKGITGLAAQTREVQIGAPTFRAKQRTEPKSVLAAPMLIGDRLIGVITAVSFDPKKRFTMHDATLYARIATVAAVVVEQSRRIAALEAMGKGKAAARAGGREERLDREIVDMVARLVKSRRHAKGTIARLLADIHALADE